MQFSEIYIFEIFIADQSEEGLLSPFLRGQRFSAIRPYLRGRILDIGCGSGQLANRLAPKDYVDVEIDRESFVSARASYRAYRFESDFPMMDEKFDTVVALAVIEHVPRPVELMERMAMHLNDSTGCRIVCTTPHPAFGWVHEFGAEIGLFSKHANDEHERLLSKEVLLNVADAAGLWMTT